MKIKPYEKNAKKHPKKQLDQLAKVVKEVGWRQPVVVNQHGVIVVGHGRWETYEKNKESLKEIWVIDDTGKTIMGAPETIPLTKDQEMMWRLADNKLNESDWDMGLVTEELKLLSPEMIDLSGFKRDIILQSTEDEYDVENGLKNEVRVNKGDIWKLGIHRLMCGDSTKKDDVGRLMDGKKADMVFTDPPYGVAYVGKTKEALTIENDAMSEEDTEAMWLAAYSEAREILRDGGAVYATVPAGPLHLSFAKVMKDFGDLRQIMVWVKDRFVMGRSDYHYRHEPILYGWKSTGSHDFQGGRDKDTVWEIARPSANREHPTMKPIELIVKAIKEGCSGGSVYDCFGGSGSTLIACEQTDRSCYMMELDPKYCTVILDRWEKLTGKKAEKIWQDQL